MKLLKFNAKIKKKNFISHQNNEKHEILRIPIHNYENHENLIIQRHNHENHEIPRIPARLTKIMKI